MVPESDAQSVSVLSEVYQFWQGLEQGAGKRSSECACRFSGVAILAEIGAGKRCSECEGPFSGVTNFGRVWRKGSGKRSSECECLCPSL